MRLVCPNCEAKYEVPDDAIPDTGRDVQCANCGHSWFQMRPRSAAAVVEDTPPQVPLAEPEIEAAYSPAENPDVLTARTEAETAPAVADEVEVEPEPLPEPVDEPAAELSADPSPEAVDAEVVEEPEVSDPQESAPAEADPSADAHETAEAPEAAEALEAAAVPETAEAGVTEASPPEEMADPLPEDASGDTEDEATAAPVLAAAAPYAVDDSVLAILREEAEREASARRAEGQPLESQPDLGLAGAPSKAGRLSVVSVSPPLDNDASAKPSARRDLLPDVEEINSTLRPSEVALADDSRSGAALPEARGGFRSGFLMVMTLAIIGAAIYITAPRISAMAPSVAGPLDTYVAGVDSLRLALDGLMRSATVAINGE